MGGRVGGGGGIGCLIGGKPHLVSLWIAKVQSQTAEEMFNWFACYAHYVKAGKRVFFCGLLTVTIAPMGRCGAHGYGGVVFATLRR